MPASLYRQPGHLLIISYSSISDTASDYNSGCTSDYGEVNSNRIITVKVFDKNNKLCINITNTYAVEPVFVNNTPVSDKAGHGIGIRSIISVIEKYNGVYDSLLRMECFIFRRVYKIYTTIKRTVIYGDSPFSLY